MRYTVLFLAAALLAFGTGVVAVQRNWTALIIVMFAIVWISGFALQRVRCDNCGLPILKRRVVIRGKERYRWQGFPSRTCARCGAPL